MSRVAVVTGGTRGIGAAISEELHKAGYKVAATYQGQDKAAKEFSERVGVPHFKFNVSDFEQCREGLKAIEAALGHVEILVNNAGITRDAFLHKMSIEQWTDVMNTNLNSLFYMCRLVIDSMRSHGFGRIINISSINGQGGQVGQTNYSAAKSGVIGFTKALALESASKGITVNAIAPGYIDTEMVRSVSPEVLEKIVAKIPTRRLGTPKEVAHMVKFLASDEAAFANGATFTVNGGQYLH